MPNADTFSVPPIGAFVHKYLRASKVSIDPFSRNKRWCTHTNDLNPNTEAENHMEAEEFLVMLAKGGVCADLVVIDPPYSPRQVKECYDGIGIKMKQTDALLGYTRKRLKKAICAVTTKDSVVLWFGWNSTGMGRTTGFDLIEILLCCHGSDHNDTICTAERRLPPEPDLFGSPLTGKS